MARIVVAVGGNALGDTPSEQVENVARASEPLAELILQGHQVVLCHGNGPQVGLIDQAFRMGANADSTIPVMPLAECTALSQGYIGYHLQQALSNRLRTMGSGTQCVCLVTEVLVAADDQAFLNPTKPIGSFVNETTARKLMEENPGATFKEDAGRGWREVVASPNPVEILQRDCIRTLLESGLVVIACGGGGIPVVMDNGGTRGVTGVIDKDLSAAELARELDAELLVILTAVDQVAIGWGTDRQRWLDSIDVRTLRAYLEAGEFAEGSMKPKLEAAVRFVEGDPQRKCVIGSLRNAGATLKGESGTRIVPEPFPVPDSLRN